MVRLLLLGLFAALVAACGSIQDAADGPGHIGPDDLHRCIVSIQLPDGTYGTGWRECDAEESAMLDLPALTSASAAGNEISAVFTDATKTPASAALTLGNDRVGSCNRLFGHGESSPTATNTIRWSSLLYDELYIIRRYGTNDCTGPLMLEFVQTPLAPGTPTPTPAFGSTFVVLLALRDPSPSFSSRDRWVMFWSTMALGLVGLCLGMMATLAIYLSQDLPIVLADYNLLYSWVIDFSQLGYSKEETLERLNVGYVWHALATTSLMIFVMAGQIVAAITRTGGEISADATLRGGSRGA